MDLVKDSLQKFYLVIYSLHENFYFFNLIFTYVVDNSCQNALDLINGKLIVDNNWPVGTYCQWLISAGDENSYITLEFQNINVSLEILSFRRNHYTKMIEIL